MDRDEALSLATAALKSTGIEDVEVMICRSAVASAIQQAWQDGNAAKKVEPLEAPPWRYEDV